MKRLMGILGGLWKIWFLLIFTLSLFVLYPIFYFLLSSKKRFPTCLKWMRGWSYFLQLLSGITLVVKGREELPKPPYIICSNHHSYIDIVLMYGVIPEYFIFFGKAEINSWPLFNIFFTKGMNIYVDRASVTDARKAMERATRDIQKGHSIAIFPEGTIPNSAPKLSRFKNGAFKLAIEQQVPIVPVSFSHNWRRMQGSVLFKGKAGPGFAPAQIHPPVETTGMTDEDLPALREKVFGVIESGL